MSTTKNKVGLKETIAILSLYFVSMGFTVVTPAMAKLAAAFPDNNFSLISTLPTLFVVFATLWAGTVAGKKVKYRTLATVPAHRVANTTKRVDRKSVV